MTYFSLFQQVTGSDLNTLQRDFDTEVRQLKSEIQQLESLIASTKSSLKYDIVMAGYDIKSSIQDFIDKLLFTAAITILGWIYVFLIAYFLTHLK
jgi:sugar-specific transcriptional regulator TrmB